MIGALCATLINFTSLSSQAELIDRGGGLIYDDILDVTWLQDANYAKTTGAASMYSGAMTWYEATAWVSGLTYFDSVRNVIYDDWRLPTIGPINGSSFNMLLSADGTTDNGYATTTTDGTDGGWRDAGGTPVSEMGHMYYVNLASTGRCDSSLPYCIENAVYGLTSTGLFPNLLSRNYWSGTEFDAGNAWRYGFSDGGSRVVSKDSFRFAWAVREGDVFANLFRCDLNDNDEVDAGDLSQVLRMVHGNIAEDLDCDLNNGGLGDGVISIADIEIVTRVVLGDIPAIPN